jgi:eukaryotic translation initiation factor 2-alpha kinase 4
MYDRQDDLPEHIRQSQQQAAGLFPVVRARLTEIFRLHGAVDMDPMLLMPVTGEENENNVMLLDKHGDPLILPGDGILPLARLAAKREVTRIKRYHIGEVYKAK